VLPCRCSSISSGSSSRTRSVGVWGPPHRSVDSEHAMPRRGREVASADKKRGLSDPRGLSATLKIVSCYDAAAARWPVVARVDARPVRRSGAKIEHQAPRRCKVRAGRARPDHWCMSLQKGQVYYWNTKTNKTTWNKPGAKVCPTHPIRGDGEIQSRGCS